jgi:hypothetical protein
MLVLAFSLLFLFYTRPDSRVVVVECQELRTHFSTEEKRNKKKSVESDNNIKVMGMSLCEDDEDVMMGSHH